MTQYPSPPNPPFSATQLLALWDRGAPGDSSRRARALLDAAGVGAEPLPIGVANAHLMALRERWFGPDIACLASCPACDATLEISFPLAGLYALAADVEPVPSEGLRVDTDTGMLRVRLPTYDDLEALAADTTGGARALLARCLLEEPDGALTDTAIAAAAARMEAADPLATPRIEVRCDTCRTVFAAGFDTVAFLWAEVDTHARRLLGEVHLLASAYGWREADILALSPVRRQAYREMARAK